MKQADQPAANSCSGLVPLPALPGGRQFDVEASVGAAGGAVAAAGRVRLGRVQDFFDLTHGRLLFPGGRRQEEITSRANLRKEPQTLSIAGLTAERAVTS